MVKSRRLFLLSAVCFVYNTSNPSDLIPVIGDSAHSDTNPFDGHTLWIVDEYTDECLSPFGFAPCGDTNLWKWRTVGNDLVMFEQVLSIDGKNLKPEESNNKEEEKLCLGREMSISHSHPQTVLTKCSQRALTATTWDYDPDLMILSTATGVMSKFLGSLCVVRDGDFASTQNCNMGYTRLRLVIHTTRKGQSSQLMSNEYVNTLQLANSEKIRHPIEHGEWICARTGLILPRNLDSHLPPWQSSKKHHSSKTTTAGGTSQSNGGSTSSSNGHREDRQILMGADVFTKTVFNYDFKVYTVGWYVEMQGARKDPSLRAFETLSDSELATSPAFYEAMVEPDAQYDRTVFIKIAMTLKTDLMINGLVNELGVSRENARLLKEASQAYTAPEMKRGLDVLFTWRYARPSTNNKEIFEIRMDGVLYAALEEPGLCRDFFHQFVHPQEPVSPRAKIAYTHGFPTLLRSGSVGGYGSHGQAKSHEVIKNLQPTHDSLDRPVRRELDGTLPPLRGRLVWTASSIASSSSSGEGGASGVGVDTSSGRRLKSDVRRLWKGGLTDGASPMASSSSSDSAEEPAASAVIGPLRAWRDRCIMPYLYTWAEGIVHWWEILSLTETDPNHRHSHRHRAKGELSIPPHPHLWKDPSEGFQDHVYGIPPLLVSTDKLKTLFGSISTFKNRERIRSGRWADRNRDGVKIANKDSHRQQDYSSNEGRDGSHRLSHQHRRRQAQEDSLLITERVGRRREELFATIFVVCYLGLLLVLSLPPAMIRRVRKGAAIVKSKLRHINRHINHKIHQTLSMPSMPTHGSWQSSLSSLVTKNPPLSPTKHLQEKSPHSSSLTAMRTVSFSPSSAAGQAYASAAYFARSQSTFVVTMKKPRVQESEDLTEVDASTFSLQPSVSVSSPIKSSSSPSPSSSP